MRGEVLSLHLSPLWPFNSTMDIQKDHSSSRSVPKSPRCANVSLYLDDMLFLHQQKKELVETRGLALDHLENLGFLIYYKKSELP